MKKLLTMALLGVLAASPALARGQQSSEMQDQQTVRQVQQQLQQQGYDVGQVDGQWGPRSRQALMNFQRDQNLQATGRPDQQSLAALGVQTGSQQAETPSEQTRQRSQGQSGSQDWESQGMGGQSR